MGALWDPTPYGTPPDPVCPHVAPPLQVVSSPRRLTLGEYPAVMVDTGNDFTAILDDDGALYGCGANWKGQLLV